MFATNHFTQSGKAGLKALMLSTTLLTAAPITLSTLAATPVLAAAPIDALSAEDRALLEKNADLTAKLSKQEISAIIDEFWTEHEPFRNYVVDYSKDTYFHFKRAMMQMSRKNVRTHPKEYVDLFRMRAAHQENPPHDPVVRIYHDPDEACDDTNKNSNTACAEEATNAVGPLINPNYNAAEAYSENQTTAHIAAGDLVQSVNYSAPMEYFVEESGATLPFVSC